MSSDQVVRADRIIDAPAEVIFDLIADPSNQPEWDGNDNLTSASPGQRVRAVGAVFVMTLTTGGVRENHVDEFEEGRAIGWRPAEPGLPTPGHRWAFHLEPDSAGRTRVEHVYDWSELTDPGRLARAQATTAANLVASLDRLAVVAAARARES